MKTSFKEIAYILFNVGRDVLGILLIPIIMTTVKIFFIALMLWGAVKLLPHNLDINHINFWSYVLVVSSVRLLSIKYNEFDDTEEDSETVPKTPKYLQDNEIEEEIVPIDELLPPSNIRRSITPNESTRE